MKATAIIDVVKGVTKKWAKQRKAEEREASAVMNRRNAMIRSRHVSVKQAAWMCMERAYYQASANGKLPAHARQIMYAARPHILRMADRDLGDKFDRYFTQTLLPTYIEETGVSWDVVFDARGHFAEPHQSGNVPLGTLEVRQHLASVATHRERAPEFNIEENAFPTVGPKNRYGAILFIEKEGFMPLFRAVKLAERFDIAIMSTKGMSVTAARELVDTLCGNHRIPLLILRDFDKSGFSIAGTLSKSNRRYTFHNKIKAIDLGLRLEDVKAEGLTGEDVFYNESAASVRANLKANGALEDEIEFLMRERVELNAFASDHLVRWIERKLETVGVRKVIPNDDTLAVAYRRMRRQAIIQCRIDKLLNEFDCEETIQVPGDLAAKIDAEQKKVPDLRWDAVVHHLARHEDEASEGEA